MACASSLFSLVYSTAVSFTTVFSNCYSLLLFKNNPQSYRLEGN